MSFRERNAAMLTMTFSNAAMHTAFPAPTVPMSIKPVTTEPTTAPAVLKAYTEPTPAFLLSFFKFWQKNYF